jgi:hypothetical protein
MSFDPVELHIPLMEHFAILALKCPFPRLVIVCITPLTIRRQVRWPEGQRLPGDPECPNHRSNPILRETSDMTLPHHALFAFSLVRQ